jgi:hypothetical protein
MWAIFWYAVRYLSNSGLISNARRISFYILVSGISIFWSWDASEFIATCKSGPCDRPECLLRLLALQDISLPLFFSLFIGYKLRYKTKMVSITHRAWSSITWTPVDAFI